MSKDSTKLITYRLSLITLLFLFLLQSCFTPTEGCLDINATNFDASADEQCESCCNFPQLRLTVFHSVVTESSSGADSCINHSSSFPLTNNGGDNVFQINTMSFYLSDFQLVMVDGTIKEVDDTITLSIFEDVISQISKDTLVKDDFVLVERSQPSYTVGNFTGPGAYLQVNFKVGISSALSTTDVDTLAISHPLSSSEGMHFGARDTGFILQNFSIVNDTATSLTAITNYEIGKDDFNTIPVELDFLRNFEPGFDITIPLKVNYSKWLEGINFATDDEATIKAMIVSNTAEAFEIDE